MAEARRVLGVVVGVCVAAGVLMAAFLGPSRVASLHGVRLGVVGPPAEVARLAAGLHGRAPGGFTVQAQRDPATARSGLTHRRLDAAVTLSAPGGTWQLMTASAASTTLATAVTAAVSGAATAAGARLAVDDVVAPGRDDPHATAPFFVVLPLVISGLLAAVALTLVLRLRPAELVAGLVAFAVGGGLVAALVAAAVLGALGGHAGALVLAGALVAAAVAWAAAGLRTVLGLAGLGVAALVILVIGTTSSGGPTAVALLPAGWRQVGPYLPPGAGTELVRDAAYFGGHGVAQSVTVLSAWAAIGMAAVVAGRMLRPRHTRAGDPPAQGA